MAKYKVGDKVRIVSEMPRDSDFALDMRRFLGGEITISKVTEWDGAPHYYSEEATPKGLVDRALFSIVGVPGYYFRENWIAGLAESEKFTDENLSVNIHFHGRLTLAELIKDGKVVKAENARCNPKDKYSMAEGARIAVERLFRKKPSSSNNASKVRSVDDIASGIATGVRGAIEPKIGDKFVVIKRGCSGHHFNLGDVVTLVELRLDGAFKFVDKTGLLQTLYCDEVTYWRNASNEQTESNP